MPGMKPPQKWQIIGDIATTIINENTITIDAEDVEKVKKYRWYFGFHSLRTKKHGKMIYFSQLIMSNNAHRYSFIDKDSNNYRKANLTADQSLTSRLRTKQSKSSSIYKGVNFCKYKSKWRATIKINERVKFLGFFMFEHDAAMVYDKKLVELYGEKSYTNGKMVKSGVITPRDSQEKFWMEYFNGQTET